MNKSPFPITNKVDKVPGTSIVSVAIILNKKQELTPENLLKNY